MLPLAFKHKGNFSDFLEWGMSNKNIKLKNIQCFCLMQHFNSAVEWNTSIFYTFWLLLLPGVLLCRVVTSSAPLMPELYVPEVIEVTCSFPSRWFVLLVGLHNENKTKKIWMDFIKMLSILAAMSSIITVTHSAVKGEKCESLWII